MECEAHPGKSMILVCITCDTTLVCISCITDKQHLGHVFEPTDKIANDIKDDLKLKLTAVCKNEIDLESDMKNVQTMQKQQDIKQEEYIESIEKRRDVFVNATRDMADTLVSDYKKQFQTNSAKMDAAIVEITTKLEIVRQHKEEANRIINDKDGTAVVRHSRHLMEFDIERKPDPVLADIKLTFGELNTDVLKLGFMGEAPKIQKLAVLESTITHSDSTFVDGMCCGSNGMVWVKCSDEKRLTLIDKDGHVEKSMTFDVSVGGMSTVRDGKLLVCDKEGRNIKQFIISSGKGSKVFSTGKLYPQHICTAPGGDLYVTLVDKHDYTTSATSERVLIRYSPNGRERGRARNDQRGDVLFVNPSIVVTSNIGDVIGVTNDTDKHNSHLVLLHTDLSLRLRYLGNGKVVTAEEEFNTTTYKPEAKYALNDFIFDSSDNIIICEVYSRCVQLLTKDCISLRTILPTQASTPMSIILTANGEKMWIGFKDGTVKMYQ